MLPTGHLLAFALLSFVLIIVPGPNVLFVISRSLMLGRAAGVGTAAGGQIGVYLQVVAVAFGVGALVERSVAVFTVIKLAGAAYLVYLGVQAIRHRRSLRAALDYLQAASIHVESLTVHMPDLDDVFLALTGRRAEEHRTEEKEAAR